MEDEETPCPKQEDGQHCNCWYDGQACCACGDPANVPDAPTRPLSLARVLAATEQARDKSRMIASKLLAAVGMAKDSRAIELARAEAAEAARPRAGRER